jgi:hypothetical protein
VFDPVNPNDEILWLNKYSTASLFNKSGEIDKVLGTLYTEMQAASTEKNNEDRFLIGPFDALDNLYACDDFPAGMEPQAKVAIREAMKTWKDYRLGYKFHYTQDHKPYYFNDHMTAVQDFFTGFRKPSSTTNHQESRNEKFKTWLKM